MTEYKAGEWTVESCTKSKPGRTDDGREYVTGWRCKETHEHLGADLFAAAARLRARDESE